MIRRIAVASLLLVFAPAPGTAQESPRQPLTFGGEAGTFSELYGISGADRRRPTATGRLYLRPTMSLFGRVSIAGDFLLSTEGNRFGAQARQNINQYSLTPSWSWGRATVGDFSGSYTPLTYNGIRARGASLEVERGRFAVSAFGGRSQRATPGGAVSGSYSRTLTGARIGIGDPDRTALALQFVSARDDPGSLGAPTDTIFPGQEPDTAFVQDTLSIGDQNQFATTPQQNLVMSLMGSLAVLDERVKLRGELAGSGYTRDVRSPPIENPEVLERVPGIARNLFTPRRSSYADYAYTLEAEVRPAGPLSTTLTFRNLGPGYVSLGTASMHSDRRELRARTSLRYRRTHASFDVGRQHDNLRGQKASTTRRDRIATSVTARITPRWTSSIRLQRATLDSRPPEPERLMAYGSWMVGGRQVLSFGRGGILRTVSLDYNYRTTGDENPLRASSESRSHTTNASLVLAPSRVFSITPTAGLVRSRFGEAGWTTRSNLGIGSQLALQRGRWVSGINLGRANMQQTSALQINATSRYQVTTRDAIILGIRAADYENVLDADRSFREATASLRWAHRF